MWCLMCQLCLCRRMAVKSRDEKTLDRFKAKLSEHASRIHGVFMHYDPDLAIWIMKVNHF